MASGRYEERPRQLTCSISHPPTTARLPSYRTESRPGPIALAALGVVERALMMARLPAQKTRLLFLNARPTISTRVDVATPQRTDEQ